MLTRSARTHGFTLIEVLIAIVVLAIGLLGLAKLQVGTNQYEMESYQRAQGVILLQDMVNRLNANRVVASCYDTTIYSPTWLGTGFTGTPICTAGTATEQATAIADMTQWDQQLKGASETVNNGNTSVGAMINARGCIKYDATVSPPQSVVTVVYQGLMQTASPDPSLTCAQGQYGPDTQRRAVSAVVNYAKLN
jgi:type IV pilus assembly protein PilV